MQAKNDNISKVDLAYKEQLHELFNRMADINHHHPNAFKLFLSDIYEFMEKVVNERLKSRKMTTD